MNISAWLRDLGLERYVKAFEDHDVDEQTLCRLTEGDLLEIGVKSVGHRRRLSEAIAALGRRVQRPPVSPAPAPSQEPPMPSMPPMPPTVAVSAVATMSPMPDDARQRKPLAAMVGREQELALLMDRWAQARGGEGQAVLLVGEPGIGKSRLARAVLSASVVQPHARILWKCSPYHTGSALWPVIQRLGHAAGLGVHDSPDAALDKLEALVGGGHDSAALYATLLGLNGTQRYGPLEMTPQMLRERTLEVLAEELLEMAEQRALLLVVEDAHWIDPTTLELVQRCLDRIEHARLLLLITSRPDHQPDLGGHPSVARLSLNRLSRVSMQAIVARLGGDRLQAHTVATIVAQAEGVPLFVEELTKAVLETGETTIPASLYDSLMARLDHLPQVKEVAQIAACIGREFEQALVRSVAEHPELVNAALDRLAEAELIFRRGDKADPRFTFKHALVQEAACESLAPHRREHIHARILEVLEGPGTQAAPEILAHHAERAKNIGKAIEYWGRAGKAALANSAYAESASDLERAIGLIRATPGEGRAHRAQELELQLCLGQAHIAIHGFGFESTRRAFDRANELFEADLSNVKEGLRANYGLWAVHVTRCELDKALQLATRALAAAHADRTPGMLLHGYRLIASSHLFMGNLSSARDYFEPAVALLDRVDRGELTAQFGVDPAVQILAYLSLLNCLQGFADRSREFEAQAHRTAAPLPQVSAKAHMLLLLAMRAVCARDGAALAANTGALDELASMHRLGMYKTYAEVLVNLGLLASAAPSEAAITAVERGVSGLLAAESRVWVPLIIAGQAQALASVGQHPEARRAVERALHECEETAQGWCEPELWRVRGELLLRGPQPDPAMAARSFERAMAIARGCGAGLWELRAAASLARLWSSQGERARALDLLAPVYGWFTEGFDTPDLVEARALLGER